MTRRADRRGEMSLAGILLVFLTWSSAIAVDQELDADRVEFVLGNATFVALHELAHAVITDFEVPVLGNAEDAADTLAAVYLIRRDRADPASDFRYIRMLLMAADANRIFWNRGVERNNMLAYLTSHPLSVQRAARIACLVYGSNPEVLEPLPEMVGLPELRSYWCEEEYAEAERAALWFGDSYVRKAPGRVNEHSFYYGSARGGELEAIRDWLVDNQALERVLAYVEESELLTDSVTFATRSCGSPEAYWDSDERSLVVCYELLLAFYKLSVEQGIIELERKIHSFHRE